MTHWLRVSCSTNWARRPYISGVSYGIWTRVAAVRGRRPRPLDEGDNLYLFYQLYFLFSTLIYICDIWFFRISTYMRNYYACYHGGYYASIFFIKIQNFYKFLLILFQIIVKLCFFLLYFSNHDNINNNVCIKGHSWTNNFWN